jgi:UPF0716 protein FxsA
VFGKLFILFAILPIIEIAILVNVGEVIGGWNTVLLVILSAFIGAYLVRQQGFSTLMQAQTKMQAGAMPGQEMAEGLLLVIAGVLLVTPGFVTDILGFVFCLPMTRPIIAKKLLKHLAVKVVTTQQGGFHQQYSNEEFYRQNNNRGRGDSQDSDIIEGEFENKSDGASDDKNNPKIGP